MTTTTASDKHTYTVEYLSATGWRNFFFDKDKKNFDSLREARAAWEFMYSNLRGGTIRKEKLPAMIRIVREDGKVEAY